MRPEATRAVPLDGEAVQVHLCRLREGLQMQGLLRYACISWIGSWASLEYHLRLHEEPHPYRCTYEDCGREFMSPKSLKKHQRLWHNIDGKDGNTESLLRNRITKMQSKYKVGVPSLLLKRRKNWKKSTDSWRRRWSPIKCSSARTRRWNVSWHLSPATPLWTTSRTSESIWFFVAFQCSGPKRRWLCWRWRL